MSYATLQDLIDRYGEQELIQLTDDTGSGLIDETKVNDALAGQSAIMDGYIGVVKTLPLDNPPPFLKSICEVRARYQLYRDAVPELLQKQFDSTTKTLEQIASGKITLGADTAAAPPSNDLPAVSPNAPGRTFTTDTLKDYTSDGLC